MRSQIAIVLAATLAFGAGSFASTGPAAAFTKDELVLKLMHGNKRGSDTLSVMPQNRAQFVISPGGPKGKGIGTPQMLVVAPPGGITQTGGKNKMIVQPMIVQPGSGIQATPVKTNPQFPQMVVQPSQVIAGPSADQLRQMGQRRIVVEERKQLATIVAQNDLPSVDMEVYFAYDSSAIEPASIQSLIALGQALSDVRLKGSTFLIAGHTDAVGSPDYNQGLSERRAFAIKDFLVQNFHLDAQSLIAVGYGEEQLKNPADPASGVNRRVQVANLS